MDRRPGFRSMSASHRYRPVSVWIACLLVIGALLASCRPRGPVAIDYGADFGDYCTMMITDPRYGTELVTDTGKVYTFDSIECMVGFMIEGPVAADRVHSLWVSDFANPGTLIRAEEAYYLQSGSLRSPMAVNITAFARRQDLDAIRVDHDGLELVFADLASVVRASGFLGREAAERLHEAPSHEGER